jgi:lipopolysaccharide biosynthesis glycosyltransferase
MEENFIWMDVDTLLRSGWDRLLSLPKIPPGFISRAVPELSPNLQEDVNNQAVQKAGASYFNAGIMQIDPTAFREYDLDKKWKVLAKEYNQRHFRYADQCILNYMLAGLSIPLPKEFNFVPSFWRVKEQQAPSVIHFAGKRKPWLVPKFERNPVFDMFRVHRIDTEYFRLYWDVERELLNEAKLFSYEFSKKLDLLRQSQIMSMEISINRLVNRLH